MVCFVVVCSTEVMNKYTHLYKSTHFNVFVCMCMCFWFNKKVPMYRMRNRENKSE